MATGSGRTVDEKFIQTPIAVEEFGLRDTEEVLYNIAARDGVEGISRADEYLDAMDVINELPSKFLGVAKAHRAKGLAQVSDRSVYVNNEKGAFEYTLLRCGSEDKIVQRDLITGEEVSISLPWMREINLLASDGENMYFRYREMINRSSYTFIGRYEGYDNYDRVGRFQMRCPENDYRHADSEVDGVFIENGKLSVKFRCPAATETLEMSNPRLSGLLE